MVVGRGTSFVGQLGDVVTDVTTAGEAGCMVLLDGERKPLYFGANSLMPVSEESTRHMVAGE